MALCDGNPLVTNGFPLQRASYAENISMSWRLHDRNWMNKKHYDGTGMILVDVGMRYFVRHSHAPTSHIYVSGILNMNFTTKFIHWNTFDTKSLLRNITKTLMESQWKRASINQRRQIFFHHNLNSELKHGAYLELTWQAMNLVCNVIWTKWVVNVWYHPSLRLFTVSYPGPLVHNVSYSPYP